MVSRPLASVSPVRNFSTPSSSFTSLPSVSHKIFRRLSISTAFRRFFPNMLGTVSRLFFRAPARSSIRRSCRSYTLANAGACLAIQCGRLIMPLSKLMSSLNRCRISGSSAARAARRMVMSRMEVRRPWAMVARTCVGFPVPRRIPATTRGFLFCRHTPVVRP